MIAELPDHHPYYYKWLNGYQATYGKGEWKRQGWMPHISRLVPCASGYHGCTPDGLLPWIATDLYRIEVRGDWCWKDEGKVIVVQQARIISKVKQWNERTARLCAADFAEWAVARYWTDASDTRPYETIQTVRDFANGLATMEQLNDAEAAATAARAATRGAARVAAGTAAWAACWESRIISLGAADMAVWTAAASQMRRLATVNPVLRRAAWAETRALTEEELNQILINRLIAEA